LGILSDGTPFLSGRALATLCGVHHSVIQGLTDDWTAEVPKARISTIRDILSARGLSFEKPYVATWQKGSAVFFAYPDAVCLAVLEYYAFEANQGSRDTAIKNFRALAGHALREFIYAQLGYDPSTNVPQVWKQFHDRVSLVYNAIPAGYFGIFKEIADMIVTVFRPRCKWVRPWRSVGRSVHLGQRRSRRKNGIVEVQVRGQSTG